MKWWYTAWSVAALAFIYAIGFSAPFTTSSIVALAAWTVFVLIIVLVAWRKDRNSDRQGD